MYRRLPMRARLASPSRRPQRRIAEIEEDEAPRPTWRRVDDGEDEVAAASSADLPLLAMHLLPHGGPNSFPDA